MSVLKNYICRRGNTLREAATLGDALRMRLHELPLRRGFV